MHGTYCNCLITFVIERYYNLADAFISYIKMREPTDCNTIFNFKHIIIVIS